MTVPDRVLTFIFWWWGSVDGGVNEIEEDEDEYGVDKDDNSDNDKYEVVAGGGR
jgi:hypothetical protein